MQKDLPGKDFPIKMTKSNKGCEKFLLHLMLFLDKKGWMFAIRPITSFQEAKIVELE